MADLAESISTDINAALNADELELPSLPEVALRIREEAESEFVSAVSLAKVVAEDPALAAQLIRIANSPMFRATRSIDDLGQAISRLGVDHSANVVTGLAMQNMFQATSDFIDRKLRQIWSVSTDVAAWSSILCNHKTRLRPDQATLAGLTHCIGVLPILGWAEEHDHLLRDSMTLDRVIEQLHPSIGGMILRSWNFADDIIAVPETYQNINRSAASADYVDIVGAATHLITMDADQHLADQEWANAPAFGRLGLTQDLPEEEFEHLREEVGAAQSVFA